MPLAELMRGLLFTDGDWIETKDQDPGGRIRLVQLADVGEGGFRDRSSRFVNEETATRLHCTFLQSGDVLVARMPEPLGRACLLPDLGMQAITAVDVCVLRPDVASVNASWLMWAINSPQVRQQILALQTGTTRKRISRKNLSTVRLAVPPFPEQQRVVAAIEEQFSRLDAAEASTRSGQERLGLLRQAVREATSSGTWPSKMLSDVTDLVTGTTPSTKVQEYWGRGLPFITPGDFAHGDRIASGQREVTSEGASRARPLPAKSVLLTCIGATIGKTALATTECVTNQQITALVPDDHELSADFLFQLVCSPSFQRSVIAHSSSTTLPILNKARLARLSLPVPPLDVQERIVENVEAALSVADGIENGLVGASRRASSLRAAILRDAFTGRLVQNAVRAHQVTT